MCQSPNLPTVKHRGLEVSHVGASRSITAMSHACRIEYFWKKCSAAYGAVERRKAIGSNSTQTTSAILPEYDDILRSEILSGHKWCLSGCINSLRRKGSAKRLPQHAETGRGLKTHVSIFSFRLIFLLPSPEAFLCEYNMITKENVRVCSEEIRKSRGCCSEICVAMQQRLSARV